MLGITRKKYIRNFYVASTGNKSSRFERRKEYLINLEKSLIISIVIVILCFKLYPRFTENKLNIEAKGMSLLEVIDIPIVKLEQPPPPPPVKIIEPITSVKIKDEKKKKSLKDEIKDVDLKLDISNEDDELLLANSQLGDISSIDFSGRLFKGENFGSFDLEYKSSRSNLSTDNSLSLDLPNARVEKKIKEKSLTLDTKNFLQTNEEKPKPNSNKNKDAEVDKFITLNKDQFLLKESESTIGTKEFQTWNRINSALDRLNKDRYGELPGNVKRISNGLSVTFAYRNGGYHDIFWSKGGKVVIRVTGARPKNQLEELQRAYDALLRLIYELNNSRS